MGGSRAMHGIHQLGVWAILVFLIIHIFAAIREDIMSCQSMVSTMISGIVPGDAGQGKDGRPD